MKTPRETVFELLMRIELGGAYADRMLASRDHDRYDPRDRAFIREIVNGVLRWKLRLDRITDSYYNKPADALSPPVRMILRIGLYQMMFMSVPAHAAVNESVELASTAQGRGAGGLVNALLRRFQREGEPEMPSDEIARLSSEQSYPEWMTRRWVSAFGQEETERIMRAGNERHPVFVFVNPLVGTVTELSSALDDAGFGGDPIAWMPGYLAIREAEGLFSSEFFKTGRFIAQDPAAGMAAVLLDPRPEMRVIDLCAAPGGKTVDIAAMMGDTGTVVALDLHPGRSGLVSETVARLGLRSVTTVVGDAKTFEPPAGELFDRVLLDAPCSGTAVFAKRPDMKWKRKEDDFVRLSQAQSVMIDNAARLLKPDGVMVYSTCALEYEENDAVVHAFLEHSPDFESVQDSRFEKFRAEYGYLLPPHLAGGTGAYAAKLKRKPE